MTRKRMAPWLLWIGVSAAVLTVGALAFMVYHFTSKHTRAVTTHAGPSSPYGVVQARLHRRLVSTARAGDLVQLQYEGPRATQPKTFGYSLNGRAAVAIATTPKDTWAWTIPALFTDALAFTVTFSDGVVVTSTNVAISPQWSATGPSELVVGQSARFSLACSNDLAFVGRPTMEVSEDDKTWRHIPSIYYNGAKKQFVFTPTEPTPVLYARIRTTHLVAGGYPRELLCSLGPLSVVDLSPPASRTSGGIATLVVTALDGGVPSTYQCGQAVKLTWTTEALDLQSIRVQWSTRDTTGFVDLLDQALPAYQGTAVVDLPSRATVGKATVLYLKVVDAANSANSAVAAALSLVKPTWAFADTANVDGESTQFEVTVQAAAVDGTFFDTSQWTYTLQAEGGCATVVTDWSTYGELSMNFTTIPNQYVLVFNAAVKPLPWFDANNTACFSNGGAVVLRLSLGYKPWNGSTLTPCPVTITLTAAASQDNTQKDETWGDATVGPVSSDGTTMLPFAQAYYAPDIVEMAWFPAVNTVVNSDVTWKLQCGDQPPVNLQNGTDRNHRSLHFPIPDFAFGDQCRLLLFIQDDPSQKPLVSAPFRISARFGLSASVTSVAVGGLVGVKLYISGPRVLLTEKPLLLYGSQQASPNDFYISEQNSVLNWFVPNALLGTTVSVSFLTQGLSDNVTSSAVSLEVNQVDPTFEFTVGSVSDPMASQWVGAPGIFAVDTVTLGSINANADKWKAVVANPSLYRVYIIGGTSGNRLNSTNETTLVGAANGDLSVNLQALNVPPLEPASYQLVLQSVDKVQLLFSQSFVISAGFRAVYHDIPADKRFAMGLCLDTSGQIGNALSNYTFRLFTVGNIEITSLLDVPVGTMDNLTLYVKSADEQGFDWTRDVAAGASYILPVRNPLRLQTMPLLLHVYHNQVPSGMATVPVKAIRGQIFQVLPPEVFADYQADAKQPPQNAKCPASATGITGTWNNHPRVHLWHPSFGLILSDIQDNKTAAQWITTVATSAIADVPTFRFDGLSCADSLPPVATDATLAALTQFPWYSGDLTPESANLVRRSNFILIQSPDAAAFANGLPAFNIAGSFVRNAPTDQCVMGSGLAPSASVFQDIFNNTKNRQYQLRSMYDQGLIFSSQNDCASLQVGPVITHFVAPSSTTKGFRWKFVGTWPKYFVESECKTVMACPNQLDDNTSVLMGYCGDYISMSDNHRFELQIVNAADGTCRIKSNDKPGYVATSRRCLPDEDPCGSLTGVEWKWNDHLLLPSTQDNPTVDSLWRIESVA